LTFSISSASLLVCYDVFLSPYFNEKLSDDYRRLYLVSGYPEEGGLLTFYELFFLGDNESTDAHSAFNVVAFLSGCFWTVWSYLFSYYCKALKTV